MANDQPSAGRSGDEWPLVGRSKQLSRLTAAVTEQRGAVITGPAGAGKTALAMACLRLTRERGMSVARAAATQASRQLAFGALASMLPDPGPDSGRDPLDRMDHGELLRRYSKAVVAAAGARPLVVFVDDAHLLDDGSATLVHHLALTGAATVLATVQSGTPQPDPVVALWKDGPAERVEVRALDDGVIEELLISVLGGVVDAASVRQLEQRCRGNLLFLRELVSGSLETGTLAADRGIWRLAGALRPTARLVELVALRLGDLSAAERAVLELLALGEPLGQRELAERADPAAVDGLERKGLITSRLDGRRVQVGLAHPVHGDVVRTGISALLERRITRSLAEVIEATGGRRRDDPLRLASLRLVGGGGSAALLVTGAIAARRRNDHALTEGLARAAITEGGGRQARLLAAEAAHLQGRPSQAERELAELAADVQATDAQATGAPTDAERARVALLRFDNAFFLRGRADFRLLDDAAAAIDDPFWRDELLARRRYVTDLSTGPRVAVAALSQVRPGTTTPTGHIQTAYSLARLGRLDEAMQLLRPPPGGGLIPAADASWEQWDLFAARVIPLVYAGRLGEAEELLTLAYGQVIAQPAAEGGGFADSRLAYLHLEQGRPMSAFRRGSQACALFQQLRRPFLARWGYIAAAHALALAGQADRAAETLAALDALGLPTIPAAEADLLQARAWTAAAAGNLPAARRQLDAAVGLGEQIGDLIGATTALHGLARLGGSRQVAARLTALAAEVDGDLTTARAAYARAAADRDSEALGKISREFENLGTLLYAAEASAEAATALRAAAQGRAAAAAEQRAARLLARCEGAATPPVRVITRRVRLTPGELDSALQAAAGHSNKHIAAGLQLSVRTVESHLQRAYEKLGISGRRDLASALRDQPFSSPHPGNQ